MSEPGPPIPTSTIEFYHALPVPEGPPPREHYWLHALLLVATCFTTLVVGARMEFNFLHNLPPFAAGDEYIPFFPIGWVLARPSRLLLGIPFSATLLTILLAHEMGHYLYCRYYGVRATLPFFIPAPTLIGTLGAVIRIKAPIRSRAALFDIGIAGPIAGFVVAIATLAVAMTMSKPLVPGMGPSDLRLGYPEIFYLVHDALRSFVPGHAAASLPLGRVYLHPTAIAAWVGMFATALNLLPSSQLDGGHIVYASGTARASSDFVGHGDRTCLPGAYVRGMARVGGADHCDECPYVPAAAGAGLPSPSGQPVDSRFAGGSHAGADLHGFSF